MSPKMRWFLVLSPLLFGFDFGSKAAARGLELGEKISVIEGWLAITHAENPYIAFSVPVPFAAIVAFGSVALVGLVAQLWHLRADARMQAAGLAAMASGAVGNLVDRIADGTVTDMVMVYTRHPALAPWLRERFGTSVWPIFNVADVALLVGVALFVWGQAREPEDDTLPDEPAAA